MASPPSPPPTLSTSKDLEELARKTLSADSANPYTFVDPFPKEVQHECPICLQILQKPQMISCCGNRFCLKCTESLRSTKCPLCNMKDVQFFPDKQLERQISQRKVYCSLRNDGCDWVGELCKLKDHLDGHNMAACQYLPVPCHYCSEYVRRRNMDAHGKHCSQQHLKCDFCGYKFKTLFQLRTHYRKCQASPTACPNVYCSKAVKKARELEAHLEECPWSTLTCEYQHAGCDRKILRKDMESHLQENMQRHLDLVKEKLSRLEEEVENRGEVGFLVISDIPEDGLNEHKLKSRFGQFGKVERVQLLDEDLSAAIIEFSFPETYQRVIEESRRGNIKLCREYVQANPVYTTMTEEDSSTDNSLADDSEESLY